MTVKEANAARKTVVALGYRGDVFGTAPQRRVVVSRYGNVVTTLYDESDVDSFVKGCNK